jgi:hypothetical protein
VKRHSILTTLFPRLPFARKSLKDLVHEFGEAVQQTSHHPLKPGIGELKRQGDIYDVFIPRFLPSLEVCGKKVQCNLCYREVGSDHELVEASGNMAVVLTHLEVLDVNGEDIDSYVGRGADVYYPLENDVEGSDKRSLVFQALAGLLSNKQVAQLHFTITIFVVHDDVTTESKSLQNAERRERLARELTTGYRRFVSLLLVTLSAAAHIKRGLEGRDLPVVLNQIDGANQVQTMKTVGQETDLHSTREDAWRLLCTFHTIEVAAKEANKTGAEPPSDFVLGLQDFVSSLTELPNKESQPATSVKIIERLYQSKGILRPIALRKTLEYYIFEALPCMPVT